MTRTALTLALIASLTIPALADAAGPPDFQALMKEEREALALLKGFEGNWRGPATIQKPDGSTVALTQTERVGPMLDGNLLMMEGRGFAADGSMPFNALGVVSFDPANHRYLFRAWAQGFGNDFPMEVAQDTFSWSIPTGPGSVHYVATVKDDVWTEIGEFQMPGQPPRRIFEMHVKRIGDSHWPAGGALTP
ncbi:hypothetical protein BH10PSE17_BH10PSE17_37200 [soil metagenome]